MNTHNVNMNDFFVTLSVTLSFEVPLITAVYSLSELLFASRILLLQFSMFLASLHNFMYIPKRLLEIKMPTSCER